VERSNGATVRGNLYYGSTNVGGSPETSFWVSNTVSTLYFPRTLDPNLFSAQYIIKASYTGISSQQICFGPLTDKQSRSLILGFHTSPMHSVWQPCPARAVLPLTRARQFLWTTPPSPRQLVRRHFTLRKSSPTNRCSQCLPSHWLIPTPCLLRGKSRKPLMFGLLASLFIACFSALPLSIPQTAVILLCSSKSVMMTGNHKKQWGLISFQHGAESLDLLERELKGTPQ
jgi:hypothetical protein